MSPTDAIEGGGEGDIWEYIYVYTSLTLYEKKQMSLSTSSRGLTPRKQPREFSEAWEKGYRIPEEVSENVGSHKGVGGIPKNKKEKKKKGPKPLS